ncbi:MAG: hypothetical protein Q4B15_08810, partial [Lachnospiraceae bacterium]|nr:hypothetical protein [Lachnospiraceae bacterium]
ISFLKNNSVIYKSVFVRRGQALLLKRKPAGYSAISRPAVMFSAFISVLDAHRLKTIGKSNVFDLIFF